VEFRAKIRRNKKKYGTRLIIIDYLQLMKCPEAYKKGGREREVSEISATLKADAKELDVPIIALSQLNRSVEGRGEKRPLLSDLRESGSIEQDSDMVIFIHRPEYYKITKDAFGRSTKNLIELIIAKHRNGNIGDFKFWKNDNWTEIREHEKQEIINVGDVEDRELDLPF
jgi:replicative DNA helicase